MRKKPGVGVGVFILKDGKFLVGRRKSKMCDGTWGLLGGHLEFGESFEDCARRETKEESDIDIKNVEFLGVSNDIFDDKHYVTIFILAEYDFGKVMITDFDEFHEFKWVHLNELPKNLFYPLENFLDNNYNLVKEKLG